MITAKRRLVFVPSAQGIPASVDGTIHVVLDTTWTPGPDARADVVPIRPAASGILASQDLFEEALARLDAWAAEAGLADRLVADDVAWWFRAREGLWNWLHERILWRRTIERLLDGMEPETLVIPADEPALADVARGLGVTVEIQGDAGAGSARPGQSAAADRAPSGGSESLVGRLRGRIGRLGAVRRSEADERTRELDRRRAVLDARVASLMAAAERPVVVLSHMGIRQPIGGDRARLVDPNLGAVIDRLRSSGRPILVVGLGLDHRLDRDWPAIADDEGLVPQTWVQQRWDRSVADEPVGEDRAGAAEPAADDLIAAIDRGPAVALDIGGCDLGPAAWAELRTFARTVLPVARRQIPRVERMLAELRPTAILLTHEGIRTPWLVAAVRHGVPTFAVQHGVLYPTHPGYAHPRHPGLVLPSTTFVFGEEERQVLRDHGGYHADEVLATGSPRIDLDSGAGLDAAERARERSAVRAEMGIRDGDRMLVLSTVNQPFVRRFHATQMLEAVLGGPLPGIHVVIKLHPGEQDDGPYRALLDGLARVGGYDPPAMTIVRDIDLYRLLRAADAHLGLRSTVLTDAVVVGGVNLIATVQAHADMLGYVDSGVARPVRSAAELRAALDEPRPIEPAARAAFLARHFRPGDASARIAEIVLAARPPDREDGSRG